ncbi:MAG TPA: type I restriction endonuclease, partial [Chromatiaceae bacterium]|nr:type I restriction endonuclease [Chromatiaceae bacterium]
RSNNNCLDLVLFVNGLPVATLELKTDFTQTVQDAIRQYCQDRPPKDPVTRREEPLLAFKRRALVHFAVSTDEVWMTTRLGGQDTRFRPFNQGNDGGQGNPPNPDGYRTAYLWERILDRDTWLDILGRFIHLEQQVENRPDGTLAVKQVLIFPRYHQWEGVTLLEAAARAEGPGFCYLVQHSAGSGKTNSIAWLAHRLASLHDAADRKVFDSVIVITDRTLLDAQLQDAIYQFEHKHGVVVRITDERGAKSAQLVKALSDRAPIIIVTIQTFPFVLDAIRDTVSLKGRRYAVIADEAHSSQTGSAANKLKQVLTAERRAEVEEGEEIDLEDLLAAAMARRVRPESISYFAFTATPKAKTLELFGRPGPDGLPAPFHVYAMQQAIEEGFILDVLKNYTPYKLAFKLAHAGRDYDDEQVAEDQALKSLMRWVRLHPHNIAQKVRIIVEHFRAHVRWRLNG